MCNKNILINKGIFVLQFDLSELFQMAKDFLSPFSSSHVLVCRKYITGCNSETLTLQAQAVCAAPIAPPVPVIL